MQSAATLINAKAQTLMSRRDVSDTDLMQQVFSDKALDIGKPRLRWLGNPTDRAVSR